MGQEYHSLQLQFFVALIFANLLPFISILKPFHKYWECLQSCCVVKEVVAGGPEP